MPHISNYLLNGVAIPSVNTCTGALSKDGLINKFFRPLGFALADKIGGEARDKGISLATSLENYRKLGKPPRKKIEKACAKAWREWMDGTEYILSPEFVEPHLVNTTECYHGSPDLVMGSAFGDAVLGDDKLKKRLSDYKVLMNEAAYAYCDSYEDAEGKLKPVPWTVPIPGCWVWTYAPKTGLLVGTYYPTDRAVYEDFLTCKKMLAVNEKAEEYFKLNCKTIKEAA